MANNKVNPNKLLVKDYVTIGIFSLLFIVFSMLVSRIQIIPILCLAVPPAMALVMGPIYLLYIARTQKPLCITIMGIIVSFVIGFLAFGSVISFLVSLVIFIAGELIAKSGGYKNFMRNLISYVVASFWIFSGVGINWFGQDFMMQRALSYNLETEFMESVFAVATPTSFIVIFVLNIICAIISGLIAKSMLKKHFTRAGIA